MGDNKTLQGNKIFFGHVNHCFRQCGYSCLSIILSYAHVILSHLFIVFLQTHGCFCYYNPSVGGLLIRHQRNHCLKLHSWTTLICSFKEKEHLFWAFILSPLWFCGCFWRKFLFPFQLLSFICCQSFPEWEITDILSKLSLFLDTISHGKYES